MSIHRWKSSTRPSGKGPLQVIPERRRATMASARPSLLIRTSAPQPHRQQADRRAARHPARCKYGSTFQPAPKRHVASFDPTSMPGAFGARAPLPPPRTVMDVVAPVREIWVRS